MNNLRPFEISCSVRQERLPSGVCVVIVQCTSQSVSQLQSTTCVFGDDERPPFPCKQANRDVYIAASFLYKFPQVLSSLPLHIRIIIVYRLSPSIIHIIACVSEFLFSHVHKQVITVRILHPSHSITLTTIIIIIPFLISLL